MNAFDVKGVAFLCKSLFSSELYLHANVPINSPEVLRKFILKTKGKFFWSSISSRWKKTECNINVAGSR